MISPAAQAPRPMHFLGSLLALSLFACSSSNDGGASSTATNGTSSDTTSSTTDTTGAGGSTATTSSTDTTGTPTTTSGGSGGDTGSGGSGETTSGGGTAGGSFTETGVCGVRSVGIVTADSFETTEEIFLLGDEGLGDDLCIVRYTVSRVGDAPPGCDENAGQQDACLWTHLVEYSEPEVVLDENGVCENSELGMSQEAIDAIDGTQVAYGYVFEYQGHNSVLMIFDQETETWEAGVNAGWDEESGDFTFDRRDGFCSY